MEKKLILSINEDGSHSAQLINLNKIEAFGLLRYYDKELFMIFNKPRFKTATKKKKK